MRLPLRVPKQSYLFGHFFGRPDEPDREFPATTHQGIGLAAHNRAIDECTMRPPSSITLTTLSFIALIVAPPGFNNSAMAANIHAEPVRAGLPKQRHFAQSGCRQQRLDRAQVVGAVLSMPWFGGTPGPQYIGGCRIWVDPHGHYVPSEYQYNAATGNYDLQ
jgi:hypothetical protein